MAKYKRHVAPYFRDAQAYVYPQVVWDSMEVWAKSGYDWRMPPIDLVADERLKNSAVMTEVNTYVNEMFYKYIMGVESLDTFDVHVEKIKSMNIQEAIDIQQAALTRFNQR